MNIEHGLHLDRKRPQGIAELAHKLELERLEVAGALSTKRLSAGESTARTR